MVLGFGLQNQSWWVQIPHRAFPGKGNMTVNSEKVKKWRLETKQRIVDSMGGKCQVCGYNRCLSNLALHHINPKEKDFALGAIRKSPKAWIKIVEELRKCILLCHICHNELHYGMITLPENYSKFNEEFAEYKSLVKVKNKKQVCIVCSKEKEISKKSKARTCSPKCNGILKRKINWDNIDLKKLLLENKTIVEIAKEVGCSDSMVHKRIKKLGLEKK